MTFFMGVTFGSRPCLGRDQALQGAAETTPGQFRRPSLLYLHRLNDLLRRRVWSALCHCTKSLPAECPRLGLEEIVVRLIGLAPAADG